MTVNYEKTFSLQVNQMKCLSLTSIYLASCLLFVACGPAGGNEVEVKPSNEVVESAVEIQPSLSLFSGGEIPKNFRLATGD